MGDKGDGGNDMQLEINTLYNMDCMAAMKDMPDKYFELAIVDPPYGGGATLASEDDSPGTSSDPWLTRKRSRFGGIFDRYEIKATRTGGGYAEKYGKDIEHWDVAPPQEYFDELFRVSKNQIIWGGNYFDLPPTRCFIIWKKLTISESFSMAMAEYAWTSFNDNAKVFEFAPQGTPGEPRFHPTQKPVGLYKKVLQHFAQKGDKILDTHAGSASSLVACYDMGYEYMGLEIDEGYFAKAQKRLADHTAQVRLEI